MSDKPLSRRKFLYMTTVATLGALFAGHGCCPSPAPTSTATPSRTPTRTPTPTVTPTPSPTSTPQPATVRWFIGPSAGDGEEQRKAERDWIANLNTSQHTIELVAEIIDRSVALDALMTMVAAGDSPDLVGPIGMREAEKLRGLWLDLADPLADHELDGLVESAIETWTMPGYGLIGLAVALFPSALLINRELFDAIDQDYPPQAYVTDKEETDEPNEDDGFVWTMDALAELAKLLTRDVGDNAANSGSFDATAVQQFGFHVQPGDARTMATLFGPGSFVAQDGETAQCPDHWREAFRFFHGAIWESRFMPSDTYQQSRLLGYGNAFGSGHLAMAHCHLSCLCCIDEVPSWDLAAIPSAEGGVTATIKSHMVGALEGASHPEAAAETVYAIAHARELHDRWEGLPAVKHMQAGAVSALDERFSQDVTWDVLLAGLEHADIPSHESWLPNMDLAEERIGQFTVLLNGTRDLDLDDAIDELVDDLQRIFD